MFVVGRRSVCVVGRALLVVCGLLFVGLLCVVCCCVLVRCLWFGVCRVFLGCCRVLLDDWLLLLVRC